MTLTINYTLGTIEYGGFFAQGDEAADWIKDAQALSERNGLTVEENLTYILQRDGLI